MDRLIIVKALLSWRSAADIVLITAGLFFLLATGLKEAEGPA